MPDIYLLIEGLQQGPYKEDDVRHYLAEGRIQGDLPAWYEGLQDWIPVAQALIPVRNPSPPVPPPPPMTDVSQVRSLPAGQFNNDELRNIIKRQKLVIIIFFVSIAAVFLNYTVPILGPIALIITTLFFIYVLYRLATSLRMRFAWLYCVASFIPYVSFIVFIYIFSKASTVLKDHGIRVGLLGGNLKDIGLHQPLQTPGKKRLSGLSLAVIVCLVGILVLPILAGIALGPIHNALIKAHGAGAAQLARAISLAMTAYANDHSGAYPEGKTSTEVFQQLIDGHYIPDPTIFYVPMAGKTKATSTTLSPENVCFDVTSGVSSGSSNKIPLVFSTGYTLTYTAGGSATPVSSVDDLLPGIAVAYEDTSSAFIQAEDGKVDGILPASFDPGTETYLQLTPSDAGNGTSTSPPAEQTQSNSPTTTTQSSTADSNTQIPQAVPDATTGAPDIASLRTSAEQGNVEAARKLGKLYLTGDGIPKDYTEALKWLLIAGNQGDALAQNNLGIMYSNGLGVTKDDSQAFAWLQKAANQGNAIGEYNIAIAYFNGTGVAQDYTQAFSWCQKAANQGDTDGQYAIGGMYENGEGTAKDMTAAVAWYKKSAAQGQADAQSALKRLGVSND
jgi:hypothetical protein